MHYDNTGDQSFLSDDISGQSAPNDSWKRPRSRRRHTPSLQSSSGLNEVKGRGLRRPKFKRVTCKTHEVTLSLTPRQAVVWLMNLDSISDLYEMTTGEVLRPESRAQLRAVLRALARECGGATTC
jgi:hypothetical protein